ncbi:alpha/beta fold hydrolase [Streptomyces sp. NPDC050564]|uniref:alpha/beta fold hydrolase n=1 Tax=Streptomyces sp. NPDC050564 TaxID=3365631 RepID=UPI00379523BE
MRRVVEPERRHPRTARRGLPRTLAVANPLRGVVDDADHLRGVLAGNADVKALVYIGAFAPDAGESAADLAGRYPGSTLGETLAPVKLPDGSVDPYIRQELYHAQFAADSPEREAAVMAVTQRPIAESALAEPSGEPAWRTIPSWFLIGGKDKNIPAASQRFMAERAGSRRTVELPDGSHTVGSPEAAAVVGLVREAVAASAAHE